MNAREPREPQWLGMTCAALDGPGALRLQSYARAPLAADEIRIAIAAAGVNFVDLLLTRGLYQYRPPLPFIPGLEAAGTVIECGADVTSHRVGDRVVASAHTGMYATEVITKASEAWPAPAAFSWDEAACWRVAALTARHALVDCAQVRAGEIVLVLGAGGGMGLAAVELAALLGAEVIAAASSAAKLEAALGRGARHAVDYSSQALPAAVRAVAPQGVDVVFDPVGGELFEASLRLCRWGGRVLATGFASGGIGRVPMNVPLLKGSSVLGVRAGEANRRDPELARRSQAELQAWAAAGHLRPYVSARWPLAEAAEALASLDTRRAVGRIALDCTAP